jgi:NADH:ubiquinone oxidoreductase subunit 5 (subunit L)/multisubunit Na+/H+ antiporter MnhA subunit
METYPQLVPLVILFPAVGAFINIFWGARLGEKWSGWLATVMSGLTFVVAVLLYSYLVNNNYNAAVVAPSFLDGWIRIPSGGVEIPWQQRVDTLSVTMMLFVTFVGTLIHIYAIGYMHGDSRFSRFFVYLNMFLAFMLILITGNNFLMMFVGWEGVGLCSYLLIGFWWDKAKGVGWRNSNAARKAFIVNRIGDFGLMLGIFLIFWTFGTLDYYRPGELANPAMLAHAAEGGHGAEEGAVEDEHATEATTEGEHSTEATTEGEHTTEAATEEHAAEEAFTNNDHIPTEQLGVFGQAERMLEENRQVTFGPFTLDIKSVITLITLFLLIGATGKSAQIPLFVWLPDAMAGPTPVSALIHAATMVTAGVYMMVRSNVFYHNAEVTSFIVTLIGAGTALVAGYIAMGQWDIKRVLAYSTISQLGFMVAAVGIGAYGAAMFHMITHAFFKALLFLGSGSVIHGMEHGHHHAHEHGHGHDEHHDAYHDDHHHEEEFDPQDMRNMGGLKDRMPITYWTYLIGTLALAGIIPFAGFWSKDEILADGWIVFTQTNRVEAFIAFATLLVAAGFTAFYMWRQMEMVFYGKPRTEAAEHAPESAPTMVVPLIILGFFSIVIGFLINFPTGLLGLDSIFGAHNLTTFLEWSVAYAHAADFQPVIAFIALAIGVGAIMAAMRYYGNNRGIVDHKYDRMQKDAALNPVWSLANARLYWDEIYFRLFENPFNIISKVLADTLDWAFWHDYFHNTIIRGGFNALAGLLSKPVDLGIIDGAVLGVGRLTRWASGKLRQTQTGYVRVYAIALLIGVVAVIVIMLLPMFTQS